MRRLTCFCPPETTESLRCPERGFYTILPFTAEEEPFTTEVFPLHPDDTLLLVEINLEKYAGAPLTTQALYGIDRLFERLRATGCGIIVRFLYDWCGKNILTEPKRIETILGHIGQLGRVIRKNADIIYLLQGLFVGNWGEMHGSRFIRGDYLKRLYAALSQATENRVRTAVRTPALWHAVTGMPLLSDPPQDKTLPGLFNDAMLGNESEYGTFSEDPSLREQELQLQKRLCRLVPYGGEAVGTEPQSDAGRAMAALARTGVSYLNRSYDENTLAKWKNAVVSGKGIWDGMSCYDYIEAHLGYRFVIRSVKLRQAALSKAVSAKLLIENIGFAPIYHNTAAELVFVQGEREEVFPMTGTVDRLSPETGACCLTAALGRLHERLGTGTYEIFFRLKSRKYNVTIPTANQGSGETGCLIGRYIGS